MKNGSSKAIILILVEACMKVLEAVVTKEVKRELERGFSEKLLEHALPVEEVLILKGGCRE